MILPIILSGGSGRRLWPLSRKNFPKQFLSLIGKNTMLQETLLRLNGLENIADPIIVCNADHRFIVLEQCHQINITSPTILLEPVGRNTAPAIIAAALQSMKQSENPVLLVLSADHTIQDIELFHNAINIAVKQAQKGKLVLFGIVPTNPNTGYGYIKPSKESSDGAYKVEKFVEKPDLLEAKSYIKNGKYLWNSGMFMFQAKTLINELSEYDPSMVSSTRTALKNATKDLDFIRLDEICFKSLESVSIDYALIERSKNVYVVPLNTKWSDLGSWDALYSDGYKDQDGNIIEGDVITNNVSNTYINASNHLIAAIGVKDLIIVDTPDATLIASQDKVNTTKEIVKFLEHSGRKEGSIHRKVFRPWGWYDSIESGNNFQVKRLNVNPGAKLSLQLHYKRAEHWVVVRGVASVTNSEKTFTLEKGESTYIPHATKHSLENKTSKPLEIIEVQSGSYLGEDDIIRFEDIYGR